MENWITSNPLVTYIIVSLAGAMIHWAQKVRRGEASADFITYWFTETPGYSIGTAGALGGGWFVLLESGSLANLSLPMLLSSAFTFGFAIDSMVSPKAAPKA
jgi:hypothetical protein